MTTTYFTEMETPLGTLTLRATSRGLTGLFMQEHRHGPLEAHRLTWRREESPFAVAITQLREYFEGERQVFAVEIDREGLGGTPFQSRVWLGLEEIPYGQTISYAELARRIQQPTAIRAVGLANGRNPLSIIVPCHRVIGSSGKLTGYGGGMERKQWLLERERGSLLANVLGT